MNLFTGVVKSHAQNHQMDVVIEAFLGSRLCYNG